METTQLLEVPEELVSEDYRLLRALPEQVSKGWPLIRALIKEAMPFAVGEDEEAMSNMMQALLVGRLVGWFLVKGREAQGFGTTYIADDTISGKRKLIVYSATAIKPISLEGWLCVTKIGRAYAKGMACDSIVVYSNNKRILQVVEKLGGDTSYRAVTLEV